METKNQKINTLRGKLDEYKDGVGIGLTLSRNIVRRLGGDIMLDTTYNDGARFIVTLPLQR